MSIQHLSEPGTSYPGEAAGCAASLADAIDPVERLGRISSNLTDAELTVTAQSLAVMMQRAEAALVALTADALDRGTVHRSTAANAAQWVQRLSTGEPAEALLGPNPESNAGPLIPVDESPSIDTATDFSAGTGGQRWSLGGVESAHAVRIARLAVACQNPDNRVLGEALLTGAVNTTIASTALANVPKICDVLPTATRDEIFGWFVQLPSGSGAKMVRELTRGIINRYCEDDEMLDDAEDTLQRHETLSWINLPEGMVRLIAELSADHAEMVKHAIQSLAAPAPVSDCCDNPHHRHDPAAAKTGEPDLRTPGKRRVDALLQLITLGAMAADEDGTIRTFGTARLVVTIDYDALARAVRGLGLTDSGATITPDTVRQLACDADIIPMVLGSKSQPLNVGRRKRLVDKELRRAVIHRDRHCTYDGCDRPPIMCEVHHVVPWWTGGETSLENSALLCGRHHRVVHRDKLSATTTDHGVTWHHARAA